MKILDSIKEIYDKEKIENLHILTKKLENKREKIEAYNKKILEEIKENPVKKVLVLSCGTGGGHNSAAKAVQEALTLKGMQADFIEYLEIISPKLKDRVNQLYLKTTHKEGRVFKRVYHLGELYQKTNFKSPVYSLNSLTKNKLLNYILKNGYSYVATSHLFAAQALTEIKKEYDIHFLAIATDYVCIPFWEETNPDYLVIPNKELEESFTSRGISKEKLLPLGIPVAQRYMKNYNKKECKKELGLEETRKYVLILNGSMGFGNVEKLVQELLKEFKNVSFMVSCGSNKELLKSLTALKNRRVIPIGFTEKLEKYIASSEIVLTKPGGLTTTEVATMRKPFIHTMPIPGCENYNANFFSSREMSFKAENIEEIIEALHTLLKSTEKQHKLIKNQEIYIDREASNKLADFIIKELS